MRSCVRTLLWISLAVAGSALAADDHPAPDEGKGTDSKSVPAAPTAPGVEHWVERLERAASESERETALEALKSVAAGPTDSPETRQAVFAVADARLARADIEPRKAVDALDAATALYPDDPQSPDLLRRLAALQLDLDDSFGAHSSYRRLIEGGHLAAGAPEWIARAAANAAKVKDMEAALRWSSEIEPEGLDPETEAALHRARLVSGQALGRYEIALDALRALEKSFPDELRIDPQALLAAARTYEAVGLLDFATRTYVWFSNVHPKEIEAGEALLGAARLQARAGNVVVAQRLFEWLIELRPTAREAFLARLDLLGLDGRPPSPESASKYGELMTMAMDASVLRTICDRFVERFLGAGLPTELAGTLMSLAEETRDDLAPIAARQCLSGALGPVLQLYAVRSDDVSLAATALRASTLGLSIPPAQKELATGALARLGLEVAESGLLRTWIDEARDLRRQEAWGALRENLEQLLSSLKEASSPDVLEARLLLAEAFWHEDRAADAVGMARAALSPNSGPVLQRRSHVLLGDLLFTSGDREAACAAYRNAASLARSRWVDLQVERCQALPSSPAAGAGAS